MSCNVSNIVFPGKFDPKTDKWIDYKERLLCSLDAVGYGENNLEKARALFLSQCGKETFALIASLLVPNRPTNVPLDDIIRVLDKFYQPEVNEILETGKFHKRNQLQTESVQDFVAAISSLGVRCNFLDLERQLRDRLVLGLRDERLRRDLLKTKKLNYEMAVQMCLDYQATFPDMYPNTSELKQIPCGSTEPMDIGKIQTNECRHCAKLHKTGERCPFVKAKCFHCKRYGHIVSACDKRSRRIQALSEERILREESSPTSTSENMMGIYVCSDNYCTPIKAVVIIEGAKLNMEIDSGASRSIISEATFKKLWPIPPVLNPTNIKLVTWTCELLQVMGQINVCVKLGVKEAQCELMVVQGNGPSLLGRNWFKLLDIEISGLCWSEEKVLDFAKKFPDLFEEGLGEYKGPLVSLHVRTEAVPKFLKARVVPFPLKKKVNEELQRMIDQGVLTPIRYSNWATPLRIVNKDDGSLRICGDYRSTVNIAIDTDSYPLPSSMEAFVKLSGGRVFSKLDLKHAYTQVKVDNETAMLMTLNTPLGLMRVNRLAFGISAAPAIFQRLMSSVLSDMEGVACLLDDIAIMGRNEAEHDQRLHCVLRKLEDMGFRLNKIKSVFGTDSITFLGHVIDQEGLHPSPAKVKEIKGKAAPKNKESLRAFLGLYNFYEKFLPDKSTLLEPLYRLLDSKSTWKWCDQEQTAFEKAKDLLSSDLTLVGYDLSKELLLICDSSEYGLGAIIAHVMEDGSERPIMMASRTMQKHERRYGQIDKEALAIMFGLKKFHEFLAGRRFCIITDHKPLVGLFNPAKPIPDQISPRMLRWSLKLSSYQYMIKYRAGKLIGNADALSRWTLPVTSNLDEVPLREVLLMEDRPAGWTVDAIKIASETKKDPILRKVLFHTLHGWPRMNTDTSLQPFWTRRNALSHNKDCLLWCNRVIIPASLREEVLQLLHEPHAGIVQTKAYARGYVWWVGMDKDIERIVAQCELCQMVRNNPPKETHTWLVTDKPWSRVHVDFAGPFQGKTFLVLIDSYSKWLEAEIVPCMSSGVVITTLRKIFASQGLPDILVSDNGRSFSSSEFNYFLKKNGIKHTYSPPYHPATNGHVERAIQTFKNKLRKMSDSMPWSEKLAKVLYHLRTIPNSGENKTAAELLNGRKFRTAVSGLHPDCAPASGDRQLESVIQGRPTRTFQVDQPILVRMYGPGEKWQKAVVEIVEGPMTYLVRTEDGELHRRHIDQIVARQINESEVNSRQAIHEPHVTQTDSSSESSDLPVEIPSSHLWPDIIGIPSNN